VNWQKTVVQALGSCQGRAFKQTPKLPTTTFFDWLATDDHKKSAKLIFSPAAAALIFPADGCKTYDSSYRHSFMSACCITVVSDLFI